MIPVKKISKKLADISDEKWGAFVHACENAKLDAPTDPDMIQAIKMVFALSEFAAKRCVQRPDILIDLIASQDIHHNYPIGGYAEKISRCCALVKDQQQLSLLLRQLRIREMCRIAFRDLAGWSDLSETMKDLSNLADSCLHFTQSILHQWLAEEYGLPKGKNGEAQGLVILGLGKLGGRELNFSSDIDLMFAFPQAGQTDHPDNPIANEQFFARLCQRVIEVIGKNLAEGFVFRVDARLRPFGESGPIAMSFDAMESYYQQMGREWERYALIKARVVAGDEAAGAELFERLKPFVYRRYLDYGNFESLREMKARITREITRKGMAGNIKLGSGGIREIEFFGQVFQLIRGGLNPDYQQRSILKVLGILARDNCVPGQVSDELAAAYVFLRNAENRIQMINDLQTHALPENVLDQARLAFSMGFEDWRSFAGILEVHMGNVHRHFDELLRTDEPASTGDDESRLISEAWHNLADKERSQEILRNLGIDQVEEAYAVLNLFRELTEADDVSIQGKKRLSLLAPQVLREVMKCKEPVKVLKSIYTLVNSFRRRSCYAALLLENPDALTHVVKLADASSWVISLLSQHPLLLDELLDIRALYAPLTKAALEEELRQRLDRFGDNDLESEMDGLRVFKQVNTLRVAAADVTGLLPLMKVSDRLTFLAETVVDQALEMSWEHLVERYGLPSGIPKGQKGFAIVAYGKLGGIELGYGSDLDLVFLNAGSKGNTGGSRMGALDNAQFYSRLGQRIIHFLTTMTRTGKLYDIDMRLRPSGSSGILVSRMDAFEDYLIKKAWTWEHQALIKARPVSGDSVVGDEFLSIRKQILCIPREKAHLKEEVAGMREKMRKERAVRSPGFFDLKQDAGGVIDIEFMVQFLILLHASKRPELTQWTDVVRQLNTLALTGIIDDRTAHILKQAYLIFRYCIHRLALEEKPALLPGERFRELRGKVRQIWETHMG